MDDRLQKLEELNSLNKSGQISDNEYKILLSEILNTKSEDKEKVNNSKSQSIVDNLNVVGSYFTGIYYCIVIEIICQLIYNTLADVKMEHYRNTLENIPNYPEKNFMTKYFLEMENIDKIVDDLKYLNEIHNIIQIVIFSIFMYYLWNIGKVLKEVRIDNIYFLK